jgi:predicted DNA-binding WGR domain protein
LCEDIHLCWEKATALGVRYYEVDLHRDLWGEWRLAQAWGRRGTRLGQVRVVPCDSRDEGLARIAAILKRRQQRRYDLVAGADPGDDTLWSLLPTVRRQGPPSLSKREPGSATTPVQTGDGRNDRASDKKTSNCISK